MYITVNGTDYTCKSLKVAKQTKVYSGLPEDFSLPISGEISLKSNDGNVMRTDVSEDYMYHRFNNGILTLTNIPETEPIEPTPIREEATTDEMAIAILEGVNEV